VRRRQRKHHYVMIGVGRLSFIADRDGDNTKHRTRHMVEGNSGAAFGHIGLFDGMKVRIITTPQEAVSRWGIKK
jgi:hypothetical protein